MRRGRRPSRPHLLAVGEQERARLARAASRTPNAVAESIPLLGERGAKPPAATRASERSRAARIIRSAREWGGADERSGWSEPGGSKAQTRATTGREPASPAYVRAKRDGGAV